MATANLSSNLINVFPSTRRIYPQEFSPKLMTEQAIVRSINTLMNKQGFVITEQFDQSKPVEFNIYGYYFQVKTGADILNLFSEEDPAPTSIYAYIDIDDYNGYAELKVSAEEGSSSTFDGVTFTSTQPSSLANRYSVQVLSYINNQWIINPSSTAWFSIDLDEIDGGVIS